MANRFYAPGEALNPFDGTALVASSDADVATFLGVTGEQNNKVYKNIAGVRNYSSTTPLVISNKTIRFGNGEIVGPIQHNDSDLVVQFSDTAGGRRIVPGISTSSSSRITLEQAEAAFGVASGGLIGQTFFVGTVEYTITAASNSVSGNSRVGFTVTPTTDPGAGNALTTAASTPTARLNVTDVGRHIFMVNCRLDVYNATTSNSASASYTPFSSVPSPTSVNQGFNVGTLGSANRPDNNGDTIATSRGIHLIGSQVVLFGNNADSRTNMGFGVVQDTTFQNSSDGSLRYYFHSNETGVTDSFQDGATFDNRISGPNNFVNLHSGTYIIRRPEFIGCSPFTNDGSAIVLEGYANPSPFVDSGGTRYYGIGNRGDDHGFYSINATTRIPNADLNTSVTYNRAGSNNDRVFSGQVIEGSRYKPTFYSDVARTIPVQSVKAIVNTQHSFGTAGNEFTMLTTTNANRETDYISDDNGRFSSGDFNPYDGSSSITFDEGLIFPIVRIVGDNSAQTNIDQNSASTSVLFNNTIQLRSLFNVIDESTGIRDFTINQASELARTNASEDIVESAFFPDNTNLTPALLSGTRTNSAYNAALNIRLTTTSPISEQDIYDALVYSFFQNDTDQPWPIASGSTFTWDGNISLGQTSSHSMYDENTDTLNSRGNSFSTDTDAPTNVIELINNGGINLGGVRATLNVTSSNINNPRLVSTLSDDRADDISIDGDFNGTLNINTNNDMNLVVPSSFISSDSLTITNSGSGIVTVVPEEPLVAGDANFTIPNVTFTAPGVVGQTAPPAPDVVREPFIARFPNVPLGSKWILVDFTSDEYNVLTSNTHGRIIAASYISGNNASARDGTTLNFRSTFPAASGNQIAVPTNQRGNDAYQGLEITRFGSDTSNGDIDRIVLIVYGTLFNSSVSAMTVDTTIATRLSTENPSPTVETLTTSTTSNNTVTPLGTLDAATLSYNPSAERKVTINIDGHSPLVTGERKANFTQTNAIIANGKNDDFYGAAIFNALGVTDADEYPRNNIPAVGDNVSFQYDPIVIRAVDTSNVRQGTYTMNGGASASGRQLQQVSGLYEVNNDALASTIEATATQLGQGLSNDVIAVEAIADNSMTIDIVDTDGNTFSSPSVLSDERILTADTLSGAESRINTHTTALNVATS